ncbi:laccase-11-like [Phoenix dactylifera]|uniref:Laccase-11-like n=1 Tax=Phoenix dactylifera TaxID=42345 RepID=A0A8B9A613_PHODC|nr:laccase-11-like [Phoenix dactylifera]
MPKIGLLQAHYFNIKGVFRLDFPDKPVTTFNYTGVPLTANHGTSLGTWLSRIARNSTLELVFQDTDLTVELHPFHLHGYNFFVLGRGIGNFDPVKDQLSLTWLMHQKGTLLVFLQEVGQQFYSRLIIQVFGSCTVI